MIRSFAFAAALSVAVPAIAAPAYTFTQIDGAGSNNTGLFGINDQGQMVGFTGPSGSSSGLLVSGGAQSTQNYPGATQTGSLGITNSGTILSNVLNGGSYGSYLLSNGSYSSFAYSGSGVTRTDGGGISSNGSFISGTYYSSSEIGAVVQHGSTYTPVNVPGAAFTTGWGVNSSGESVGYAVINGVNLAYTAQNGVSSLLGLPPGAAQSQAFGINDGGQIVGVAYVGGQQQSFLYSGGAYSFLSLPVSNLIYADAYGINNKGQIVGQFQDNSGYHGFLLTPASVGTLINVVGTVLIKTSQGATYPGINGTPIQQGDQIISGSNGGGTLVYADGRQISFGYNTQLDVSSVQNSSSSGPISTILNLVKGHLDVQVSCGGTQPQPVPCLQINTPVAVAAVRDPHFTVDFSPDNGLGLESIDVLDGLVDVTNLLTSSAQQLGAGQSVVINGVDVDEPSTLLLAGIACGAFVARTVRRRKMLPHGAAPEADDRPRARSDFH